MVIMSSYLNLSIPVSHLIYVGEITGLISSKKRPVPCISQPSLRHPPDENITTILLREIGCVIHCGRNR